MSKEKLMAINVLSPRIYNRIAAGEVVEKPASIVKELVENSLDAGATKIKVDIEDGGIRKITVADNGCGISKEDLPLAFLPHATSKISSIDDLDEIATLGFRGEALASIASVCQVSLSTKTKTAETGYKIEANGGDISSVSEVARVEGTTLVAQNLFFNTPARAKFLRKPKTEEGDITHLIEKFMLAHPEIDFEYVVDGKLIYNHASGKLDEVVYLIYGKDIYEKLLQLDYSEDNIKVSGYVVSPKISRPNRTFQSLFVNGRYVENYLISACVQGAFEPLLMKGRFPVYIIKLDLPYDRVDVNVHPNKKEVKFDNSSKVFGAVRRAVEKALVGTNLIAEFEFSNKEQEDWSKFDIKNEKEPQRTSFDSYTKTDVMSEHEGASFKVSVDDKELNETLVSPAEYQKKGIDIINMPEFATVKNDESRKNRPGGNIFFDQSGQSLLREVELEVKKDIEQEKKIAPSVEFKEEKFLTAKAEEIKIVGVVFKTYIITEFEDSLYIIDQHAMHERQNYEKLKKQIENGNVAQQDLLLPYEVKLLAKDREFFASKVKNLQQIGFDVKRNGDIFEITAVPFVLSNVNLEKFVAEILSSDEYSTKTASSLINDKLCQSACKHSIRAGDSVSKDEIVYLIEQMQDKIPLCPHGRPIIAKMTRKDLEKMFKRVL